MPSNGGLDDLRKYEIRLCVVSSLSLTERCKQVMAVVVQVMLRFPERKLDGYASAGLRPGLRSHLSYCQSAAAIVNLFAKAQWPVIEQFTIRDS